MKRKRYPQNFKEQLVKEAQEAGNALSVAKRHGISEKSLYRWIQESKYKSWKEADGNAKKVTNRNSQQVDCSGICKQNGIENCWCS